jgi:hypothetical protein
VAQRGDAAAVQALLAKDSDGYTALIRVEFQQRYESDMEITRRMRHGRLHSAFLEPIVGVGLGRVVATSDKLLGGAKDWLFVFQRTKQKPKISVT